MEQSYEWWGLRVRAMRRSQRLTQRDLALLTELPNVSKDTISRIESGRQAPSLELAFALSRVLGTPVEVLFSEPESTEVDAA